MSILISGDTARTLTFRRATLVKNPDGTTTPSWQDTITVDVDAQPSGGTKPINTRLAQMYSQMYSLFLDGNPDIRRQDRVTIDGLEFIVESVNPFFDHLEVEAGGRLPTGGQ